MSREDELSAYVADELDAEARERFEARMATDPRLAREVASLRALSARLQRLPTEAWELAQGEAVTPRSRPRWPLARPGPRARPYLGAAVACAIGVLAGAVLTRTPPAHGPAVALVALTPVAGGAQGKVTVTGGDEVILTVARLPRPDARHYFEAWLMTDATHLVALGSFRTGADGRATLQTTLPAGVHAYRYVDVSMQAVGAGPAHSSESVLRGPTAGL